MFGSPGDPACDADAETLFVDGANGVCRDVRVPGAIGAGAWLAAALGLALAWAMLSRARPARRSLLLLVVVAALPGFEAVLSIRADRPAAVDETARVTSRLHDALRGFARAHGCAEVTVHACPSCEPVARLALAGLSCGSPAAIELREGAFGGRCVAEGARLVCAGAPR